MLRFTNVTKVYPRGGVALDNVSFGLRRGEFAFLTGSSGAGKSTLLKLIHMEERPTSGEVLVGTTSSLTLKRGEIPQLRRRLGVVFQDFRLLETRTAEQNVAFALEVTGTPRNAIPGKVARALHQVGLASKATAYPTELSGGEQQRVAIARALVNDPFLLIADEPTGNLDERATRSIFQLLRDISAAGTAVLMATHDLDMVRRSAFRNIELDHGRIVNDTAVETLSSLPDPFVSAGASTQS
jgi:cell division transport system ATP-binding protein